MKKFFRTAAPFIVPLGLLITAFFCQSRLEALSPGLKWLVGRLPYILFTAAAILSWRFNRSRAFFIVLVLAAGELFISAAPVLLHGNKSAISLVTTAAAMLIPINLLVFSLLKERGVFTVWGLMNTAFIVLQTGFVYYLLKSGSRVLTAINQWNMIPRDIKVPGQLPQLSLLIYIAVLAAMLIRFIATRSCPDAAAPGVLSAVFLAVSLNRGILTIPVFFSAAGVIMIVSVIQDSYSMAFLDELTGLPSRRSLKYELMKLSGKYTIAMLDIDFFKKFNDTYGHDVGDQVLKMVAGCIKDVSGSGKPFRYGGEEFTVVFPNRTLKEALPFLEELRETVSKKGFVQRSADRPKNKPKNGRGKSGTGKQLFVTISIGAAEKNDRNRLPDEVIKAADKALYRAKKKGRNCVSR